MTEVITLEDQMNCKQKEVKAMCWAEDPAHFLTFIAPSRPPHPLRTQLLRNICFIVRTVPGGGRLQPPACPTWDRKPSQARYMHRLEGVPSARELPTCLGTLPKSLLSIRLN